MSSLTVPFLGGPVTSMAAIVPAKITVHMAEGTSASGASANKVIIPSALSRQVMAETESGVNVVNCTDMDDLFRQLDG
jgi:hypothetical protein